MDNQKKINIKKQILIFVILLTIYFLGYYLLIECFNFSVSSKTKLGHGFGDISYFLTFLSQSILSIIISIIFFFITLIPKFYKKFKIKLFLIPLFLTIIINSFLIIDYISAQSMRAYHFFSLSFIGLPVYIPLVILYFIIIKEKYSKGKE